MLHFQVDSGGSAKVILLRISLGLDHEIPKTNFFKQIIFFKKNTLIYFRLFQMDQTNHWTKLSNFKTFQLQNFPTSKETFQLQKKLSNFKRNFPTSISSFHQFFPSVLSISSFHQLFPTSLGSFQLPFIFLFYFQIKCFNTS